MSSPNLLAAAASSAKKKAWQATPNRENDRLGCDNCTSPWNLAGGGVLADNRTRGAGLFQTTPSESTDVEESSVLKKRKKGATGDEEEDGGKPGNFRALFEVDKLKKLIKDNTRKCPKCRCKLTVTFQNCCLATRCILSCSDKTCDWQDRGEALEAADVPLADDAGSPLIERITDYAINVVYVLSHIGSGDGGREAERLLGFLGLPNSTTMERRSFVKIEQRMAPTIHAFNKEVMAENLIMEVEGLVNDDTVDFDQQAFDLWKAALREDDEDGADVALKPSIVVSADMGWQKRSSGRTYNSPSGHALLVGDNSRLPVALCVKSKICKRCDAGSLHTGCSRNHVGSSKAMEPQAILEMTVQLYDDRHTIATSIITDDDSSIKAKMKYSNADHYEVFGERPTVVNKAGVAKKRPDKGSLPQHIPQPVFLADPNHRKKTYKNEIYKLAGMPKSANLTCTKCDVFRLGVNFAFMARTLPFKEEHEYVECGKAVLEHHFDNHEYCGDWCHRKTLSDEEQSDSTKFYRSKETDADLYKHLYKVTARFTTLQALKEVAHGGDTQVNESLNNTISWLAPKNKTYGGSPSLYTRICIAIGIHSLGTHEYYRRLLGKLGIQLPKDTLYALSQWGDLRSDKIAKTKTNEFKKSRQQSDYDKLKAFTEEAQREKCTRAGVSYESFMGMNGGYTEEEINAGTANDTVQQPAKKKSRRTGKKTSGCNACGGTDHSRITSQKCSKHAEWKGNKKAASASGGGNPGEMQAMRDAIQLEQIDTLPFNNDIDIDADEADLNAFFDAYEDVDDLMIVRGEI